MSNLKPQGTIIEINIWTALFLLSIIIVIIIALKLASKPPKTTQSARRSVRGFDRSRRSANQSPGYQRSPPGLNQGFQRPDPGYDDWDDSEEILAHLRHSQSRPRRRRQNKSDEDSDEDDYDHPGVESLYDVLAEKKWYLDGDRSLNDASYKNYVVRKWAREKRPPLRENFMKRRFEDAMETGEPPFSKRSSEDGFD